MLGHLSASPQQDLITISSIDPTTGVIMLSDSTGWRVHPTDQRFFQVWNVGDVLLIGHNKGLSHAQFDAFIFNVTHFHVANALQVLQ